MNEHVQFPTFQTAVEAQEFYDNALAKVGLRAPAPVLGQSVNDYRRGTLSGVQTAVLQDHPTLSKSKVDFYNLKSDALAPYERMVLQAAPTARTNPDRIPPGVIQPIKVRDPHTGRLLHTEFYGGRLPNGEQTNIVHQLGRPGRRVVSFSTPTGRLNASGQPVR